MIKESWIFPYDGSPPYRRGERPERVSEKGFAVLSDLPDFVSHVDGKRYSGRAGMREHNIRNNVVPVEELKGLPPLLMNSDTRSREEKRGDAQHRKEVIIREVNQKVRY